MTLTIVQFAIPTGWTQEQVEAAIHRSVPRFQELPGLIRKHYLLSMETGVWGGVYLWRDRQQAEAFYGEPFRQHIRMQYGVEPTITFYDSPVTVENAAGA